MPSRMRRFHFWLGTVVALPLLGFTTSGLIYSWPGAVQGGSVETIAAARVRVAPDAAMAAADAFAGRRLPVTAVTLAMRDGRPAYEVIGGLGASSILVDAETGQARATPPPGPATRYFRQAHFYFFAGPAQVPLLVVFSGLAAVSALSGICLLLDARRR